MEYLISGGKPLKGTISVSGAKNVALKLIIAALLLKGKTTLHNVPRIRDVVALVDIINHLGGEAQFIDEHTVTIENKLTKFHIPFEFAARTRVSFMLLAPLLKTFGKASVPNPGGCRLGARPVDRLAYTAEQIGAKVVYNSEDGYYYVTLSKPHAAHIEFSKVTHTGTELAIMNAVFVKGMSVIKNAALEPEIDDMILFFNKAGADIVREGTRIIVNGVSKLVGIDMAVQYDRNEAVSYIILSALFGGSIIVKNVSAPVITFFLKKFEKAGFTYEFDKEANEFRVKVPKVIKPVDVETAPHPGFMTDWQPMWALLMTHAKGESKVHETVFENRFGYVEELKKFGARISYYDPHVFDPDVVYQFNLTHVNTTLLQAIRIHGPTKLHNGIVKMTDIRAGACLVMAALLSPGESIVSGAEQIERGYENLINKLRALGADIRSENLL